MEVTNAKNTINNFKRLIGRRFQDSHVQQEKDFNAYSIIEGPMINPPLTRNRYFMYFKYLPEPTVNMDKYLQQSHAFKSTNSKS